MDFEFVIKTEAKEADQADEDLEDGAEYDAKCDAHDAAFENLPTEEIDAAGEPDDADEDADVVEGGGGGVKDEAAKGLLDAGKDGGDREEEGVDGDYAHHIDGENHTRFVQAGADDVTYQGVGENHNQDGGDEGEDGHEV